MKIVDLTRPIVHGYPTYPGNTCGVCIEQNTSTNLNSIIVSKFSLLDMHYGTHVDLPLHFFRGGLDAASCVCLCGRAVVIENKNDVINPCEYELSSIRENDIVLLYTGWDTQPLTHYYINHPYLSEEFAYFLIKKRISCIGLDIPSPDKHDSVDFPIHNIMLGANIPIIEGMIHLQKICDPKRQVWFIAMPLKIHNGEASPIRAMAILRNDNENPSIDDIRTLFIR